MEISFHPDSSSREKYTVWDDYVPIVSKDNTHIVYISDSIESPANYAKLCFLLDSATEEDTFVININSPGGNLDSAFQIRDSIITSKAATKIVKLAGVVASAATIIALAGDKLYVAPHTQFMVHNYSSGTQGKGHELIAYINFNDKSIREALFEIYLGFLTKGEIDKVIKGEDMWFTADEVEKRFAKLKVR